MTTKVKVFRGLALIVCMVTMVSFVGCSSKKTKPETDEAAASADEAGGLGDSDSGKAMGLQTVHFPFDSSTLDAEGKGVLKQNASVLQEKKNLKVQVEGHCDARGGIQYNIALGERRANATRKFLEDLGVAGDRLTVISYGKERPLDSSETEQAYAKNRRSNFVITTH